MPTSALPAFGISANSAGRVATASRLGGALLWFGDGESVDWLSLLWGVVFSAIAAYACIHYFLRYIEQIGMWPFVVYRLLLGALILALLW